MQKCRRWENWKRTRVFQQGGRPGLLLVCTPSKSVVRTSHRCVRSLRKARAHLQNGRRGAAVALPTPPPTTAQQRSSLCSPPGLLLCFSQSVFHTAHCRASLQHSLPRRRSCALRPSTRRTAASSRQYRRYNYDSRLSYSDGAGHNNCGAARRRRPPPPRPSSTAVANL